MNRAIEGAKKRSDEELEEMFVNSKKAWIEKWDTIKSMEWNKKIEK